MDFTSNTAIAVYAFLAVVASIAAAWWRFIESPDRQRDQARHARHSAEADRVARYAAAVESARGRWEQRIAAIPADEWADFVHSEPTDGEAYKAELHAIGAAAARDQVTAWAASVDRWETEQAMWRDALGDGPDAVWEYLSSGVLRDTPWVRS